MSDLISRQQPVARDTNVLSNDTVSRQAAIDAIYKCTDIYVTNLPPMIDKAEAYKAISDLPSTQPERTGKWIEYDNSHCECPFCHEEWSYFDNEVECFNYCPNCGARMES